MVKYKLYTFIGESINITECEIDNNELLENLSYKIGQKFIFTPYEYYEHVGQECEIIDYVRYEDGEDDWCYNVRFDDGHTQRIYEDELEIIAEQFNQLK